MLVGTTLFFGTKAQADTTSTSTDGADANATTTNNDTKAQNLQSDQVTLGSATSDATSTASASSTDSQLTAAPTTTAVNADTTTNSDDSTSATKQASISGPGISNQSSEVNNKLSQETGLTSSNNRTSSIFQGTDGKWYKFITTNGTYKAYEIVNANLGNKDEPKENNDFVNNNVKVEKVDKGNGKVHYKITFFPSHGLNYTDYNGTFANGVKGLQNARMGIALTGDYKITGDVTVTIDTPKSADNDGDGYVRGKYGVVRDPEEHVVQTFDPYNDSNANGVPNLVGSSTLGTSATNEYIQGLYFGSMLQGASANTLNNLYTLIFADKDVDQGKDLMGNDYDGDTHGILLDSFGQYKGDNSNTTNTGYTINGKTVNGSGIITASQGDSTRSYLQTGENGVNDQLQQNNINSGAPVNSRDFSTYISLKSWGMTRNSQYSSYTIEFDADHTDAIQGTLPMGNNGTQFSGVLAGFSTYQQNTQSNAYKLVGEQYTLAPNPVTYQGQDIYTTVGNLPDASQGIAEEARKGLPSDTVYTWTQAPDVSKATKMVSTTTPSKDGVGTVTTVVNEGTPAVVHVQNSTNGEGVDVPITVFVYPNPVTQDVTKTLDEVKDGLDASTTIENMSDMPTSVPADDSSETKGTRVIWVNEPDWTKVGTNQTANG